MQSIQTHVETLAEAATPETSLVAVSAQRIHRFPENVSVDLAREQQVALRLLERDARLALRNPSRDLYHAHHPEGSPWAILLAPRAAPERLYLSRADRRRFYQTQSAITAPPAAPGTLLATWPDTDHRFTHVTSDAQAHIVLYASTAERHIHIPLDAPATGQAIPFRPIGPPP